MSYRGVSGCSWSIPSMSQNIFGVKVIKFIDFVKSDYIGSHRNMIAKKKLTFE